MPLIIACGAGAERGGKREEIIRKREQRAYFSRILSSPGDCKNRDWLELLICQGRSQDFSRGTHNFAKPLQNLSSLTSFSHSVVAFAFLNSMVRLYINWMELQLGFEHTRRVRILNFEIKVFSIGWKCV